MSVNNEEVTPNEEATPLTPEEIDVARKLHDLLCNWNHTDGCGWFYHPDDWTEWAHKKYAKKAVDVLATVDYEHAVQMLNALNAKG